MNDKLQFLISIFTFLSSIVGAGVFVKYKIKDFEERITDLEKENKEILVSFGRIDEKLNNIEKNITSIKNHLDII